MHCRQINEKCFCKCDNHKTTKILSCKSKNLKDKVINLFKVTRISWFLHTPLICIAAPMNRFQHRHFDIFAEILSYYSLVCITEPEQDKNLQIKIQSGYIIQWFCRAINPFKDTWSLQIFRLENLCICLCLFKYNTLKTSHS